ncbi:lactate utilization protein [Oscillospiraceae bacterium MB08-C2-2]|nr:lactate utilization protein [Oscillospiraceae bacterium MB08-C2-2]
MDKNLSLIVEKRLERTAKALGANRIDAYVVQNTQELYEKIREVLKEGESCSVGGSMTLRETGVEAMLQNGPYEYYDRYAPGANLREIYYQALGCDVYFTSANAVTEDGKLYCMDGNGNRIAAMAYGPRNVVVVAGANKIVTDIEAARRRNREVSAPANGVRLEKTTPCALTGVCRDCATDERMCNMELVIEKGREREPGTRRIKVFLLPDSYGY